MCSTKGQKIFKALMMGIEYSGKEYISNRLARRFKLVYINVLNELQKLADAKTPFGCQIAPFLKGKLPIPDDLMLKFVMKEAQRICCDSWLIDGFPNSKYQAECFCRRFKIDVAFHITVKLSTVLDNAKYNWIHAPSGRFYTKDCPPRRPGFDDCTLEKLTKRKEDDPKFIEKVFCNYNKRMEPILDFYDGLGVLQEYEAKTPELGYNKVLNGMVQFMPELLFKKLPQGRVCIDDKKKEEDDCECQEKKKKPRDYCKDL